MFGFRTLSADDPVLDNSPLMRALDFLKTQFDANPTGILLTKSKALRRATVAEAITTIQWPDWTEREIYNSFMPIKVADEYHFEPFWILRQIMWDMRLFRHYRGHLRLTRAGAALFSDRFKLFDTVAREIIFSAPYFEAARLRGEIFGTWDIWLNVIDIEAATGGAGKTLTEVLFGPDQSAGPYDLRTSALYDGVLKPLIWAGLLDENLDLGRKLADRVFTITPLWRRYLELDPKPPRLRLVH